MSATVDVRISNSDWFAHSFIMIAHQVLTELKNIPIEFPFPSELDILLTGWRINKYLVTDYWTNRSYHNFKFRLVMSGRVLIWKLTSLVDR